MLYAGWLLLDNPEHFGSNNSCISREAGHLMGSALHSCVHLGQYLACFPCCEAICCCGDAGMSLLFEQQCTQSHKERIRMTLWPDQAEQLLSSISAAENRAHLWVHGHGFLWKSPSHPCSSPHAKATLCPGKRPCLRAKASRWHPFSCWPGRRAADGVLPAARRRQGVGTGTN